MASPEKLLVTDGHALCEVARNVLSGGSARVFYVDQAPEALIGRGALRMCPRLVMQFANASQSFVEITANLFEFDRYVRTEWLDVRPWTGVGTPGESTLVAEIREANEALVYWRRAEGTVRRRGVVLGDAIDEPYAIALFSAHGAVGLAVAELPMNVSLTESLTDIEEWSARATRTDLFAL